MPKKLKSLRFVVLLIMASFMLTGCWRNYDSNDDKETSTTPLTFAISDSRPYTKGEQIGDKLVDEKYSIYIYIVNNGGHVKDNKTSADNIKLTLIDESNLKTIVLGTKSISKGVGYVEIPNLTYDSAGTFHFHVEGHIKKNNKLEFAGVNSNSFKLEKKPLVVTPTPDPINNRLIWENEVVD